MSRFSSPLAFAEFLTRVMEHEPAALHEGVTAGATVVRDEARAEIGHYQSAAAPFAAWKELADSTKADRSRKGFPDNNPLLRTGGLRDSIEVVVHGAEASVGSNSKIALYQEVGTARIPPRSFLGGAAVRKTDAAVKAMVAPTLKLLAGK